MILLEATQKLQECIDDLHKKGFALDVKIGLKELPKKEEKVVPPKSKFILPN